MILVFVGFLMLGVLALTLIVLFIDEKRHQSTSSPTGKMTGYWDGAERRVNVRIAAILRIRYSIVKRPGQNKDSFSKNISAGGILMQLNEKLSAPTLLFLEIFLPNKERPVMAEGEVVWVKEILQMDERGRRIFDTGVKFVSVDSKDKEKLDNHIKNLL